MPVQHNPLKTARLARSLGDRLAAEAKRRGVPAVQVRKQYIFTIFLSRIFQHEHSKWVLLGGNALLIRTGGGRFTQDIDLARERAWHDLPSALEELRALSSVPFRGDLFTFDLPAIVPRRQQDRYGYGLETAEVKARGLLGGRVFESFTIDITTRRHTDVTVDRVPLRAVIDHETLRNLPSAPTTPVEHHLADKICAMYEKHGATQDRPSNRYRDLADVVRIVNSLSFDAGRLTLTLRQEAQRRELDLPERMVSPGKEWEASFPKQADDFAGYPKEFHPLEAALGFAGACLNEVLTGSRTTGVWRPDLLVWDEPSTFSSSSS